jgi:hypothetical protein
MTGSSSNGVLLCRGIVLIHMQKDIAGCPCNSKGGKKMAIN